MLSAQINDAYWGVNYGISAFNKTNFEIGYGFTTDQLYYKSKTSAIWDRYCLITADVSAELQIGDKLMISPKVSNKYSFELWEWEFNYIGIIFGADYIAYNNFKTLNNVVRPSVGVHYFYDVFELNYGYNFRLDNNPTLAINSNVVQFKFKPYIFIKSMDAMWSDKK